MYLVYSVNVYIFNVVIEIKFYSILFYSSSSLSAGQCFQLHSRTLEVRPERINNIIYILYRPKL